jgi:hypothetical protein
MLLELMMGLQAKQQEAALLTQQVALLTQQVAVQRWRVSSILADHSKVAAPMLQQLDDMQQNNLQLTVTLLKQRQLELVFTPILQFCPNSAVLAEKTDLVAQFLIHHPAPQCFEGDAGPTWTATMQLLCALQQLICFGNPDAYLQLSSTLLLAKTSADLSSHLEPVRKQLQELLDAHCKAAAEAQAPAAAAAAAAPAPAAESLFGRHPDIPAAAAAVPAAAGLEPAAGPLATSEEVLAELPSDAPAAEPCTPAAMAFSCSAVDASCQQLSCNSSNSVPVMYCDSTAAATVTVGVSAGSSNSSAMPLIMAGPIVAGALLQLPSASCSAGSCSIAEPPAAFGLATELAAAAAAADGMAAGLELLSCSKPEAAGPVTIMVYADYQFETESCEASSTSSSLPEQYDTAAAAANSSALIQLSTISSSGSECLEQQGVEASGGWQLDYNFTFGCDFAASSNSSSSIDFSSVSSKDSNGSSSSSVQSVTRKHSVLQLVPDNGPSTPAAVSVAASCTSSACASCAEHSYERSRFSSSSSSGVGLPEVPFDMGCGSGASGSMSKGTGRLPGSSKQQRKKQRGRGGLLRHVAGCVVFGVVAAWCRR